MNKFLITLFLVLFAVTAGFAQAPAKIQSPSQPKILLDDGTIVGPSNPMPVAGTFSIGSVTVAVGEPPSETKTQVISGTGVATSVVSIANRRAFAVVNHSPTETIWITTDAAIATAAVGVQIPIFPYGYFGSELASGKVISVLVPLTATATIYQDGY